ncbi:probable arginine--tRNA ligase, mitochondrial [Haliotis rufescens]|uniref:probable arginine--tRNA ligase, mitochondrial n=1 Tax=Haliotis rufescens TaxID=6454 RepID=UPI00201F02F1|nr:probable arginine--tRNA ligase, mitochondrial [Haliotis rufescens]
MAAYYRNYVIKRIVQTLNKKGAGPADLQRDVRQIIKLSQATKKYRCTDHQLQVSVGAGDGGRQLDVASVETELQQDAHTDIEAVTADKRNLYIKIKNHKFNQHILRTIQHQKELYGYKSEDDLSTVTGQQMVVEYSSPNIAKPFHTGHLRSTIIGNFVSNLFEAVGHRVTRLNYLGDWGTQFGLLLTGYHRYGDAHKLSVDPLLHLFEVYVKINHDVQAEKAKGERHTYEEALATFSRLETGDADVVNMWKEFRQVSLAEYNKIYQRLGIRFSETHTESMYDEATKTLMKHLTQANILHTDDAGVGYVEIAKRKNEEKTEEMEKVKLVKSDGTSLYLSRDIAAAVDRVNKYRFDRMHYVVDHSQRNHFLQLQSVLDLLGHQWSQQSHFHIPFGRVEGMSTRRGEVVFLRDLLDEAQGRMRQTLIEKDTTRADIDVEGVADALGISSIIVQDLKERRTSNYKFSWERMLNFKSDSGVFLQYCHARLCSIQRSFSDEDADVGDGQQLREDTAGRLILHLASYPDVVQESLRSLEPYHIVHYLFRLGHMVNAAYKHLPVKGQDAATAQARLALFDCSRQTLSNGLTLLGITPLQKM